MVNSWRPNMSGPTSVCGVDGEVNEETLMRTNDMNGAAMVEKTKSYLKKNSMAYINGTFFNSTRDQYRI